MAAVADDDEVAEQMDLDAPPRPPPLTEFGPVVRALADLNDGVNRVHSAVIAAAGTRPPSLKAYPRPRLAAERVRHRRRWAKHKALVARLKPVPQQPAAHAQAPAEPPAPAAF